MYKIIYTKREKKKALIKEKDRQRTYTDIKIYKVKI